MPILKAGHRYANKRPKTSRWINCIVPVVRDIEVSREMFEDFEDISIREPILQDPDTLTNRMGAILRTTGADQ